jgi:acylphosphatase
MAPLIRLEATVAGHVQGVGFRWFVVREARRLGLTGWVANARDGSVVTVAEGAEASIDRFAEALEQGPPGSMVTRVSAVRMPGAGAFPAFEVRSGSHPGD